MRVAWCGLGRMGVPMAAHVARAGHELVVWNRTPGRAGALLSLGAAEAASPAEAARGADVAVTMLFGPDAVRDVVLGAEGVAAGLPRGRLVIDASTIGPQAAVEIATALAATGHRFVDAPVAGSVGPATDGTLGVLAGGADADWAEAEPLLRLWGDPDRVRHLGPVGTGSAMKLVLNLTLGVAMGGVGEALRLGGDLGLRADDVLDVLATGPLGFSVSQKRPMLASGDFRPTNFSLDLMAKDLDLATAAATRDLPLTAAAGLVARAATATGRGGDDYSSLAGHLMSEGGT